MGGDILLCQITLVSSFVEWFYLCHTFGYTSYVHVFQIVQIPTTAALSSTTVVATHEVLSRVFSLFLQYNINIKFTKDSFLGTISPLTRWTCGLLMHGNQARPDSNFHGTHMGPTWVLSAKVCPMWAPWTLLSGRFCILSRDILRCGRSYRVSAPIYV